MTLAVDTSALLRRYVRTSGHGLVTEAMDDDRYTTPSWSALQSALAARAGAPGSAAALLALVPVARRLARKVSPT